MARPVEKIEEIDLPPRVLVVGGTDPTGGAGVTRDVATLSRLGVLSSVAVTAVTVQTSRGVSDVVVMPASVVGAQIDAAAIELGFDVVKTGMLCNVDIVHALADRLERLGSAARLVLDPVLSATSGRQLLGEEGRFALLERLVPRASLVTPNLPEAAVLSGRPVSSPEDMARAAEFFLARGASAVLIKGGHLVDAAPDRSTVVDLLRTLDGEELWLERTRRLGLPFRGTGCTLASAIAAGIAEGLTLRASVERARDVVERGMESAPLIGLAARPLGLGA